MDLEKSKPASNFCEQNTIEKLNLSVRTYNCLRRAGIKTIEELFSAYVQGKLFSVKTFGIKTYEEIKKSILNFINRDFNFEDEYVEEKVETYKVPEEIENIPIWEINLSSRLNNILGLNGFDTVGKILRMTQDEIFSIFGTDLKIIDKLQNIVNNIKEKGINYNKRYIDIETVKKLKENYELKYIWLAEWYNVTLERIRQILSRHKKLGNWLNKNFTEYNKNCLLYMINQEKDFVKANDGTKAYFLNNKKDDCAVIFVNDEEIKCFFMNMLLEDIQIKIKEKRLDCLSMEELKLKYSGEITYLLKRKYFQPKNISKFYEFAFLRRMSIENYCSFLTGMHYYKTAHTKITDEKITEFLNAHYINGRIMIPSSKFGNWFRRLIAKNGYTLDDIAELYGFVEKRQSQNEIDEFEIIEEDMQQHEIQSDDWVDIIFAENPLLGNKILSENQKEELYKITKKYLDEKLRYSQTQFSLKIQMQITLAIITVAKEWDSENEAGFWRYISTQFGYRDNSKLNNILSDCIFAAMKNNNRWFFSNEAGYKYKSTIIIHALTTKRSWFLLYDFLFDFYKTNMNWTYIEDDPIIARMVNALRCKLIDRDKENSDNIEINTKVYFFQEGIQKLIINRTGYAIKLINNMLKRIDEFINHIETPAKLYIDVLCDKWFENKLNNAKEIKNKITANYSVRDVATDYTKIRPVYKLQNEKNIIISLPDIRLKKSEFQRVELRIYVENIKVSTRSLSFYGNELGKTLHSFNIDLNECLQNPNSSLHIRIALYCDDEEIYNSENTLYREYLCFSGDKECDINDCERRAYSFFTTDKNDFDFSNAEISEIDTDYYCNAFYFLCRARTRFYS